MRIEWIYLIVVVPTITEWLETERFPSSSREAITDVTLTLLLAFLSWLVCHQHKRILAMAETDGLTGLLNTRRFHGDLRREVERARRQKTPLSLAYLDLDGFKSVNDNHGHTEGDVVLRRFAKLLAGRVRQHADRCYRVGGDEFAIIVPDMKGAETAAFLERIRLLTREEPAGLGRYGVSISGGVVELQEDEPPQEFVKRADELMYRAKDKGKDRIQV